MIVIGLTGSIGMGKTTTARAFAQLGYPVCDSDAVVHAIYGPGGAAVAPVEAMFPGTTSAAGVDRVALGRQVLGNPEAIARLEALVHPLVREAQAAFLAAETLRGSAAAVLDVPLLFETGRDGDMRLVVVVSAPADIQRERVLARPGMTDEKFAAILARQMPDAEKRRRAHVVIDTGHSLDHARRQVAGIVRMVRLMA